MLEVIIGSADRERILRFLIVRREGYAREIARFYDSDLSQIQKQLSRMELGGVLNSRDVGRTLLYGLNPRYPFKKELELLIKRSVDFLSEEERNLLKMNRKRPRRHGKPS
jgi:hypothetical protein